MFFVLSKILSIDLLVTRWFKCLFQESSALRAVSFSLFGELGQKLGTYDAYREQLLTNIVSIVLHLNDEEEQVKQVGAVVEKSENEFGETIYEHRSTSVTTFFRLTFHMHDLRTYKRFAKIWSFY